MTRQVSTPDLPPPFYSQCRATTRDRVIDSERPFLAKFISPPPGSVANARSGRGRERKKTRKKERKEREREKEGVAGIWIS